jgi:hypothetical protein
VNAIAMTRVAGIAASTYGQAQPPAEPPAADPPAAGADQTKPKSLDDLLGIDEAEQDAGASDAAGRDADDELQRELDEIDIADAFSLAIHKMSISADLLDNRFDPGLGTQRVQEDIIAKLSQLIEQAKKNQSRSSSSSSSSSGSNAQQPSNPQNSPGQQQNQPSSSNQRNNRPSDSGQGDPPPLQQGDVNTMLEETGQEWGNLPQRYRDMFRQGRQETKSNLYKRMTEEYYKRLAEEG